MLKILWIGLTLLGFALIAIGVIGQYYHDGMGVLTMPGMGCMALGMLARRAYFRRR